MIKILLIFLSFYSLSFSSGYQDIVKNYKEGNYKKACLSSSEIVFNTKDGEILSLIGDACLKSDYINLLGDVVKSLVSTPRYRENASYFATIILQKKLLYQFMLDNLDLSDMRLPRTSYILSIVFENIAKKNYKIIDSKQKKLQIKVKKKTYILWSSNTKPIKVFIDGYKGNLLLKRHWYL
jgi:hypothetical protein